MRQWVYYVPEIETLVIVLPDYVGYEDEHPFEVGMGYMQYDFPLLDARQSSEFRNCIYIGEL